MWWIIELIWTWCVLHSQTRLPFKVQLTHWPLVLKSVALTSIDSSNGCWHTAAKPWIGLHLVSEIVPSSVAAPCMPRRWLQFKFRDFGIFTSELHVLYLKEDELCIFLSIPFRENSVSSLLFKYACANRTRCMHLFKEGSRRKGAANTGFKYVKKQKRLNPTGQ